MDKNQAYVQNVTIEEVPWHRITTAYDMASDFPEFFNEIWAMDSLASVKDALSEIMNDIEHQGTLWHSTPFAMIFLVRILDHAIAETQKKEIADYIITTLLDFFELIVECCYDFYGEMEEGDTEAALPFFSDMLKEEYLGSENEDEEYDLSIFEENEELFNSCWHYSYQTLLFGKPVLEKLENTPFREKAKELLEML